MTTQGINFIGFGTLVYCDAEKPNTLIIKLPSNDPQCTNKIIKKIQKIQQYEMNFVVQKNQKTIKKDTIKITGSFVKKCTFAEISSLLLQNARFGIDIKNDQCILSVLESEEDFLVDITQLKHLCFQILEALPEDKEVKSGENRNVGEFLKSNIKLISVVIIALLALFVSFCSPCYELIRKCIYSPTTR